MSGVKLPVVQRPSTRGDCVKGPRPCPWASCRYNLLVDLNGSTLKLPLGELDEEFELRHPDNTLCALDYAVGLTLEEVGGLLGLTRERVRQIEADAMFRYRARVHQKALDREDDRETTWDGWNLV